MCLVRDSATFGRSETESQTGHSGAGRERPEYHSADRLPVARETLAASRLPLDDGLETALKVALRVFRTRAPVS